MSSELPNLPPTVRRELEGDIEYVEQGGGVNGIAAMHELVNSAAEVMGRFIETIQTPFLEAHGVTDRRELSPDAQWELYYLREDWISQSHGEEDV